jgi:hypothetical protein
MKSEWQDLFAEINDMHRRNRLAGHESLLLALSNSLRFYAGSGSKSGIQHDRSNINFLILERIVLRYYSHVKNSSIEKAELLISIEHTDTHQTELYYYPGE